MQEAGGVLRRYSLRIDGFVSLHAPLAGGALLTKSLKFSGARLGLNVSTSAAGTVRVELQEDNGKPLPGFSLADCDPIYGDDLERTVSWKGSSNLSSIVGKPVRLRLELQDADVFSFRFQ